MDMFFFAFSLTFVRALALVCFLPTEIFSTGFGLRLLLSVLLAICGMPKTLQVIEINSFTYMQELLFGFLCALPLLLLVQACDLFGDLFESVRGQTSGSIADPLFSGETSHMALFCKTVAILILISAGALEMIFIQYLKSFEISALSLTLWEKVLFVFCKSLSVAMNFVVPFAILFLLIEIAAIFSSRLLPSVSLCTETFTAKMISGFAVFMAVFDTEAFTSLKIFFFRLSGEILH